jgi:hypothetical protein
VAIDPRVVGADVRVLAFQSRDLDKQEIEHTGELKYTSCCTTFVLVASTKKERIKLEESTTKERNWVLLGITEGNSRRVSQIETMLAWSVVFIIMKRDALQRLEAACK